MLHRSPDSGKTTLSQSMAELLRAADTANAVIDLDDLSKIYPDRDVPSSVTISRPSGRITRPFRNSTVGLLGRKPTWKATGESNRL